MNELDKKIFSVCGSIIADHDLMLIDLLIRGTPSNKVIEVFIDSDSELGIDRCAEISRLIIDKLDSENIITSSYRLDVSSPGIDRPLKFLRQFPKHIGRKMEFILVQNDGTEKKMSGKLTAVKENILFFIIGKEELSFPFENIKKAKVLISFS